MDQITECGLLSYPRHFAQQLCACLTAGAVRRPAYALNSSRLLSRNDQLVIQSQRPYYPSVDANDHSEAQTKLPESNAFARPRIGIMLTLYLEPRDCAAPPRMPSCMCVCELGLVDARGVVCRERVRDQEAERGLYNKNLGVGTEEDVCIWAIRLQRLL